METRRVWFSMQFIVGVGTDRLHRFAAESCCFCRCSLDPPGRILPSCAPRLWWIEELPRISITNVAWHLTNRQPGSLHWGSCWKLGFCSWPKHWCWPQHHWLLICWMEIYPVKDLKVNKHKPYYWRIRNFWKVVVGTCRCLSAGLETSGDRKRLTQFTIDRCSMFGVIWDWIFMFAHAYSWKMSDHEWSF